MVDLVIGFLGRSFGRLDDVQLHLQKFWLVSIGTAFGGILASKLALERIRDVRFARRPRTRAFANDGNVSVGTAIRKILASKSAMERRFWRPFGWQVRPGTAVSHAFGRQVGPGMAVSGALGRQVGPGTAFSKALGRSKWP